MADVYPLLQSAAEGGDAGANCHTSGGTADFLPFDLAPTTVYHSLLARPGVVTPSLPEASLLLTKPLYEDPPNHPNATYADPNDPSFNIIKAWILQGAVLQ